jgi:site-specific DNA-methyltransferase (adenine-specific)
MNDIFNDNVSLKTETPAFAKHVLPAVPSSEVYLEDCVTALKRYADNHFDLAIVDPPYGIGMDGGKIGKGIDFNKKDWDNAIPTVEYWEQLFRVSKNQIVWGGNYMTEHLKPTSAWVYWDKMQDGFGKTFSSGELAWTSYKNPMKQIRYKYQGNYIGFENSITTKSSNPEMLKIHPTQKPLALYDWLLKEFAEEGDLILDTHLGSGSSRIAAYKGGFNFVGFEIDPEYYEKQEKRFNDFKSQLRLF